MMKLLSRRDMVATAAKGALTAAGVVSAGGSTNMLASRPVAAQQPHPRQPEKETVVNEFISPNDTRYDERARGLIRIGREAIAVENDAALDAYFSKDFVLHGPRGDATLTELKAQFAAMRRSFKDFACERREIISQGRFVAARTSMSGVFVTRLDASPVGPIEPNGASMRYELITCSATMTRNASSRSGFSLTILVI